MQKHAGGRAARERASKHRGGQRVGASAAPTLIHEGERRGKMG
jgi:hypothetical protein